MLARLGLLAGALEAVVEVLNQPFFAAGNVATAGGCLASAYLAAWVIARSERVAAAAAALHYVAPVGEKESYVANAMRRITPYLPAQNENGLSNDRWNVRRMPNCGAPTPMPEPSRSS